MTVRHRQKEFDDGPRRSYGANKHVMNNYYEDECEVARVSGMPEGMGKSRYVSLEAFQFLSKKSG